MKLIKYLSMLASVAITFAGCEGNSEKKGTDEVKPEVGVQISELTARQANFTITLTDNVQQYGYVVLGGTDAIIPDAYAVVSGSVPDAIDRKTSLYTHSSGPVKCIFDIPQIADYTICSAAITENGTLSEVAVAFIQAKDIPMRPTIGKAKYMVHYDALTEEITGKPVLSEKTGTPFILSLLPWKNHPDGVLIGVEWFNAAEAFGYETSNVPFAVINPVLAGTIDWNTYTIVFDGTWILPETLSSTNNTQQPGEGSAFNTVFPNKTDKEHEGFAFMGSGDGLAPIQISFDDKGVLKTISKCGFQHCKNLNASNGVVKDAWFDAIWTEGTLVPVKD